MWVNDGIIRERRSYELVVWRCVMVGVGLVVPLIGIAVCIMLCRLFRSSTAGSRFCCWGGTPEGRLDDVKREIREMKEEIGKIKEGKR